MALVQPSLILPISAITPNQSSTIKFNFGIGNTDIIQSSKISIYDNPSATSPVATSVYNSINNIHEISATVTSGLTVETQYYITIQTYTGLNATGTASVESNRVLVWTLNSPSLTITSPALNVTISVNTLYVEANYITGITNTSLTVDNKLSYYSFQLLDGNNIIYTSGNIIGEGTKVTDTNYTINYTFNGISNGTYTLRVVGMSNQNMTVIATRSIIVETQVITFRTASVINNVCEGYITVECNITNIEGETNGEVNDDGWIQLVGLPDGINGYITWNDGYNFPATVSNTNTFSNWTLQLWGFNFKIVSNTMPSLNDNINYLIQLRNMSEGKNSVDGEIDIYIVYDPTKEHIRADLYIYPYGNRNYSISKYIPSNVINIPTNGTDLTDSDNLTVWVRSLNGDYDIKLRNITTNDPTI